MDNFYSKTLKWSLHHKKVVVALSILILVGSCSLLFTGAIGTEFIPQADQSYVEASIELQTGTRMEETSKTSRKIESLITEKYPEAELVSTSTGAEDGGFNAIFSETGSHIISLRINLVDIEKRNRDVWSIAEELRNDLAQYPEIINYTVSTTNGMSMMGGDNNVSVEIFGYDIESTTLLAKQLSDSIKTIAGARDINISRKPEKPELQVVLDQEKMATNLINTAQVSMALRNRISGFICSRYREDGDEYNIVVRMKDEFRNSVDEIENISLTNPMGKRVKLKEIGNVEEFWSPPNIDHKRKERIVTISVTPYKTSLGQLAEAIKGKIENVDKPQGVLINV